MINFGNIVGTLMQAGLSGSTTSRLQHTLSAGGQSSGGALSGLTGALTGLLGGGGGSAGGIGGMLQGVLGQAGKSLGGNNNLALGGLGALAGSLLGGGGKSMKGALGGGAMAMLGAMAFKALQGAGSGDAEPEVPLGLRQAENADQEAELERGAELVLKAMINAAKADGRIDQQEVQRIVGKLEEAGESEEARDFVLAEMSKPLDLEGFLAEARNQPYLAPQIYAASLLAIEVDTPAEKEYMRLLASNLNLDQGVVADLEQTVGLS